MRDYIVIGCSPHESSCAQVGSEGYYEQAHIQLRALIGQLRRMHPPVGSAQLKIRGFPHDFGTYYEVVCWYECDDEEAESYAYMLEEALPEQWDDDALAELIANGYRFTQN